MSVAFQGSVIGNASNVRLFNPVRCDTTANKFPGDVFRPCPAESVVDFLRPGHAVSRSRNGHKQAMPNDHVCQRVKVDAL